MGTRGGVTWQADVVEGTRDGRPPLVLLHGPAFDRAIWGPVLADLCAADPGRQVLALDMPGHGGSSPLPRADTPSVAAAVHDAVAWARLDAPVVVGHSTAAVIATVYAARYQACGVVNVDHRFTPEALTAEVRAALARLRAAGTDYLFITGRAVEPEYRRWLRLVLPQAGVEVLPAGGCLPHLACPRRFAACLCSTARWGAAI